MDADYRVAFDSTNNKTIVVADSALKYLEKFGLNVICIDSDANQKTLSDAEELINNGSIRYIYLFKDQKINDNAQNIINNHSDVKTIELHKLDNLSDDERREKEDYITIMNNNLELIKKELYQ